MKTGDPLFEKITNPDALYSAWLKVRAKNRRGGIDGRTVTDFDNNHIRYLARLRQDLLADRYEPEPTQRLRIPKSPISMDMRTLNLPTVRDKIVQETVHAALEPILEPLFLDCSYGYRPGRGPHQALYQVNRILANIPTPYVVRADINDFFGTIRHDVLDEQLRILLKSASITRIILLWLRMGSVDGAGRWRDVYSGIAQGNVISPILANCYLHKFDQYIIEAGRTMVRYADDFIIFATDRYDAEQALRQASAYLRDKLGLSLNDDPSIISSLDNGFSFLGVAFAGSRREISAGKLEKMEAKLSRIILRPWNDPAIPLAGINKTTEGWHRYYQKVVNRESLSNIYDLQQKSFASVINLAYRNGIIKDVTQGETLLQNVNFLVSPIRKERNMLVKTIVRQAYREAKTKESSLSQPAVERKIRKRKRQNAIKKAFASELVVDSPGCFIGKTSGRVVVRKNRQIVFETPESYLKIVTITGNGIGISTDVIQMCATKDIPLAIMDRHGKSLAF